uniref:Protein with SprT-like domain at the N terminus n=1 Tax=Culex tarsalis TaxID=7177 RepID=A0A1Q3F249_CULTA
MGSSDFLNSTQNLVHPEWEIVDPTPNIHILFPRFDKKFFQGKLECVQLEWSKRMYSCAGICYQKRNRFGMSCIIRLSEPLLKLRPRKDLVETLLHEMIHAYCFVLGIREGNGGHGPHFKKIMNGINKIAGTNISVYHSFHDEVNLYKTHWWKCNGVCRNRPPHYGTVKRSSNRKPGPYDFWWAQHQQDCGGEFIKIKEPSPKRKKAANKENDPVAEKGGKKRVDTTRTPKKWPTGGSISDYFSQPGSVGKSPGPFKKPYTGTAIANPGGRTVVVRKPPTTTPKPVPKEAPVKKPAPSVPPGGNLKNVKQFKDLDSDSDGSPPKKANVPLFTGSGHTLGGGGGSWAGQPGNARNSRLLAQFSPKEKKPRVDQLPKPPQETVDLSDETDYIFEAIDMGKIKQERQDAIRQDIRDSLAEGDDDEIILIDDDYDDEQGDDMNNLDDSLTDTSVIDELFSDSDVLMEEFNKTNFGGTKIKIEREEDELVSCVVCLKKIKRSAMADHLDRCYAAFLGEDDDPAPTPSTFDPNQPSTSRAGTTAKPKSHPKPDQAKLSQREEHRKILLECGYSEEDIVKALEQMEESDGQSSASTVEKRMLNDGEEIDLTMAAEECACPVCDRKMPLEEINRHLDRCLGV